MQDIFEAIEQYAEAYKRLEQIQRSRPEQIPVGDQKTGVIAEFFARIYAKRRFPEALFAFGSPSEHAWDIKVLREGRPDTKIQVKAVSAHSETSRISPIHPGWNQLWLIRLDEYLRPEALWVIQAENVAWSAQVLKNRTMPKLDRADSGSAEFRGASNETEAFLSAFVSANPSFQRTR